MKKNSKLMLMATSLLTVSIAASATSAFAWYTASKVAKVQWSEIGIKSDSSTLTVTPYLSEHTDFVKSTIEGESDNEGFTDADALKLVQNEALHKTLTDVTSNGNGTYHKPKFSPDALSIVSWYSDAQAAEHTMKLKINFAAGEASDLQLYLSGTSIPAASLPSTPLSPAEELRYSVTKGDTAEVVMYANPCGGSDEAKHLDGDETGPISGIPLSTITPPDSIASTDEKSVFNKTDGSNEVTKFDPTVNDKASFGYLGKITKGTSIDLTFNFWLEGTDKDCIFDGANGEFIDKVFAMNLNFYALETKGV